MKIDVIGECHCKKCKCKQVVLTLTAEEVHDLKALEEAVGQPNWRDVTALRTESGCVTHNMHKLRQNIRSL